MAKHLSVKLRTEWGRHRKGQILDLPEPTAQTLVRNKIAEFYTDEEAEPVVVAKVRSGKATANK